jgi:nucleoside-diphosphate-sugar epimerase
MRILVTGGAGFLGRYVVDRLRREGLEPISVDIIPNEPETRFLDVTDFPAVRDTFANLRPEVVIHLAAEGATTGKGRGLESIANPLRCFVTNFTGTLNVLEACRLSGIDKVIHMSSFIVYGRTTQAITEDTPLAPNNPYGSSKACAEFAARCYATNYGIRVLIFRSALLCGEGQKELNVLREFVLSAKRGEPLAIVGEGEHVREWLHPIDVADAFVKALAYFDDMNAKCETFVLGSTPTSMKQLAHIVVRTIGKGKVEFRESTAQAFDQYSDSRRTQRVLGWKANITVQEIVRRVASEVHL